jgi:hypothetical protein
MTVNVDKMAETLGIENARQIIHKNIMTANMDELSDTELSEAGSKIMRKNYLLANKILYGILSNAAERTHFKIQACKTVLEAYSKERILEKALKEDDKNTNISFNITVNKNNIELSREVMPHTNTMDTVKKIDAIDDIYKDAVEKENDI